MPTVISQQEGSWETQVGQQQYAQYQQRGEIVPQQSPLYGVLDPIGNSIAAVADREYYAPFHFILINERVPNATSMPDGNVYVTTAMLSFLKNRDQLAGVLCHEINHDIHHDMYRAYQISPNAPPPADFTRAAESNADRGGAYTCAQAGFNPWGMVWNFREHEGMAGPQTERRRRRPSKRRAASCRSRHAASGRPCHVRQVPRRRCRLDGACGPGADVTANAVRPTRISCASIRRTSAAPQQGYPHRLSAAAAAISSERRAVPAAPAAAVLSRVLTLSRRRGPRADVPFSNRARGRRCSIRARLAAARGR